MPKIVLADTTDVLFGFYAIILYIML